MTDYQGNSDKQKAKAGLPEKKIEKVVVSEVIIKKKPLGQKIKDMFIEADFKSVARYVVTDVLLPAARSMIVEASQRGVERMVYGEQSKFRRPGYGPRSSYGGSPLANRTDYRHPATRPPVPGGSTFPRPGRNDFILATKEEGSEVLQSMIDILEMYSEVSVADYHELLGVPTAHTDQKWGWTNLFGSSVRPIREGWVIDLPPVEPI